MNTKSISLDHVQVAKPCPASWEEMKGNDSVRFCSQCQLNVYNLSALTKLEAERLITQSEGRLCVKFYRRADGRILTQDCPVGLRAFRKRVSKIAATAFSTLLSLLTGNAVERITFAQDSILPSSKARIERKGASVIGASIEGVVVDALQDAIAKAQVTLTHQQTKRESVVVASEAGKFKFQGLESGKYTLKVTSLGFSTLTQTNIMLGESELIEINIKLEVGTMGDVFVVPKVKTSEHALPHQINRKEKPREQ